MAKFLKKGEGKNLETFNSETGASAVNDSQTRTLDILYVFISPTTYIHSLNSSQSTDR